MKAEFINHWKGERGTRLARRFCLSLFLLASSLILHPSSFALSVQPTPGPAGLDIKSIVPPLPYYLDAGWWWLIGAGVLLLLAALIGWLVLRPRKPKPSVPALSPRELAAQRLAELEQRMGSLDARTFGGAVCDVLRAYIGAEYGLRPERQTSPEFLASITGSRVFTLLEHSLLTDFLEGCDLLKFARQDATLDGKRRLLTQAADFIKGSAPLPVSASPALTASA